MTDEHKTGQRVSVERKTYLFEANFGPECARSITAQELRDLIADDRCLRASEARLTKQLAARNAEIETWKAYTADHIQTAVSRAERAEADLKAARTVDDEKVERALAAWRGTLGTSSGAMLNALTAALSPGQVGEETSPVDFDQDDERWVFPQSHDQACGGDESDAAFMQRAANTPTLSVRDTNRLFNIAARRASQPSDAVAAVEQYKDLVKQGCELHAQLLQAATDEEFIDFRGQFKMSETVLALATAVDRLARRTLPSAPDPVQEPAAKLSTDEIFYYLKDGETRYRTKEPSPFRGGSIEHQLSAYGWVKEDLRQALIKADPHYAKNQEASAPPSPKASR